MLKKTLRAKYQRKLAHVVVLADGTTLVTPRDAANVLLDVFSAGQRSIRGTPPRDRVAAGAALYLRRDFVPAARVVVLTLGRPAASPRQRV
jgi:hypothetical protein